MHCLHFIANILPIMRLLSVYSQLSLLCALCKCVTEQTKRENTECVCSCLCVGILLPPLQDIAQGTKPHCYCWDQLHSSIRMGRHAETPPGSCSVVMAQLWEWGWRWVNAHTGSSPHNLAWRLGLLFIWVKWTTDWPACPDALALLLWLLLLLRSSKSLSGTDNHPSLGKWVTYISPKPLLFFSAHQVYFLYTKTGTIPQGGGGGVVGIGGSDVKGWKWKVKHACKQKKVSPENSS